MSSVESVRCTVRFQQYDNLYGFGRGLQRLFGSGASSFTFRCIQWISSVSLSLLLPAVLFNPLFLPFPSHSARPLALATRIALPGISEVLSRIQRLHRPSWMDRQSSLTPPRRSSLSLSLPPVLTPLACSLLLRLCSRRSFSLRVYPTTRCEIILRLDISRKIHEIRCVWLAVYTWYSKFSSLSPPPPPQFFAESLPKESLRSQGARSSCLSLYIFYKYR